MKKSKLEESFVVRITISINVARGYKMKLQIISGRKIDKRQTLYPKTKIGAQRGIIQRLAIIENKESSPK